MHETRAENAPVGGFVTQCSCQQQVIQARADPEIPKSMSPCRPLTISLIGRFSCTPLGPPVLPFGPAETFPVHRPNAMG